MRNGMDSVFGLHHFAHAHNAEVGRRLARRHGREVDEGSGDRGWTSTSTTTPSPSATRCARSCAATCQPSRCRRWTRPRASRRTASGSTCSPTRGSSVVSWPAEFGGRDASLLQWVVFEEEYFARRRTAAREPERHLPAGARPCSRTARPSSWPGSCRRWRAPTRSGRRPGPSPRPAVTSPASQSRAVRDRRRLAAVGAEDVVDAGDLRRPGVRPVPHRPGRRAASRADLLPVRPARRRRDGARHPAARRRAGLRRDLPRRRVRPRRGRARRGRRRLAGRDVDRQQRARAVAALPRPVPRRRAPPGRRSPAAATDTGADRPGRRCLDRRAGLPAAHLGDGDPAGRRR